MVADVMWQFEKHALASAANSMHAPALAAWKVKLSSAESHFSRCLAAAWRHVSAVAGPGKLTIRVCYQGLVHQHHQTNPNPNPNSNQTRRPPISIVHNSRVWAQRAWLSANVAVASQLGIMRNARFLNQSFSRGTQIRVIEVWRLDAVQLTQLQLAWHGPQALCTGNRQPRSSKPC